MFIPLAYINSFFSMQDNYALSKGDFWIYWPSAVAVVAFTAAITWALDTALDNEIQLTLRSLSYLKFLGKNEKKPAVVRGISPRRHV